MREINAEVDWKPHEKCDHGMITAIDRAGRIVVPKSFRDRFNLTAGTELEIKAVGDALKLHRQGAETPGARARYSGASWQTSRGY